MATATYTVLYKSPEPRADGLALDVWVMRDDGETVQGASNHRTVLLSAATVTEARDAAALDAIVLKEVEAWGVPEADSDEARAKIKEVEAAQAKALVESQAVRDKVLAFDARLATTGRAVALGGK
jgi:hypothetical protein